MHDAASTLCAQLTARTDFFREQAAEADRLTRLTVEVMDTLKNLFLMRLWIPRGFDGYELSLPDALAVYRTAARIDGSLGWSIMIGAGGGLFAAHMEPATAQAIFGHVRSLIAGSGAPDGTAEELPDGYRVNGRWRWASGALHATTFTANCILTRDGEPLRDADGAPRIRAMAFTPAQVELQQTWDAVGMCGTGSHDFTVRDAWVPRERSFTVDHTAPREAGPLYRLPFGVLTELPVTAVALGIAEHALAAFVELASRQRTSAIAAPSRLANDSTVQQAFAQAHAGCGRVGVLLDALSRDAWHAVEAGRQPDATELASITAHCADAVAELVRVVDALARLAGMAATVRDGELARAVRDLQTLAAHAAVSPRRLAAAGRALLLDRGA